MQQQEASKSQLTVDDAEKLQKIEKMLLPKQAFSKCLECQKTYEASLKAMVAEVNNAFNTGHANAISEEAIKIGLKQFETNALCSKHLEEKLKSSVTVTAFDFHSRILYLVEFLKMGESFQSPMVQFHNRKEIHTQDSLFAITRSVDYPFWARDAVVSFINNEVGKYNEVGK